jgi:hypothetical protein
MIFALLLALGRVPHESAEERALAYLAREVPRWSAEHKCYSCHHNGDAARALYTAKRLGYAIPAKALEDTSRWLAQPLNWDHNGGEGPFSDKVLSRIQFAAALIAALDAGALNDKRRLAQAAELVAQQQGKDGGWQIGAEGAIGSPATYGATLATASARRVLLRADAKHYREAIARADRWLRGTQVKSVLDAAGVVLGLEGADDDDANRQRERCLAIIQKGEDRKGGWGPYVTSSPEPFDTALVVLALSVEPDTKATEPRRRRGRAYLLSIQKEDGSWAETTRPAGEQSYAQRLSTSGWVTLALLATEPAKSFK